MRVINAIPDLIGNPEGVGGMVIASVSEAIRSPRIVIASHHGVAVRRGILGLTL